MLGVAIDPARSRNGPELVMHPSVVVLVIIFEGARKVTLHATQAQAWRQLMEFVDRRWETRLGRTPSPIEPEARADQFFRNDADDLYAIIDADVSELQNALA